MAVVLIITTGGTIAARVDPATGAALPLVRADELLEQVPALATVAEVRLAEFSLVLSWNVTPLMMAELARRVRAALADTAVAGAVITHGTDTMEETAFVLDLLLDEHAPVVLTGAMRNPSLSGPDGPRNLLGAVRVAADPQARDLGVLLAMNDEVHAARHVTKRHSTALDTFASPGLGPVGLLDDAGFWPRWRPGPLPHFAPVDPEPRVHLVKMAAGADDLLLRAVLDGGGSGLIVEGSGSGNVYSGWQKAIEALVKAGVPVVLVSRTGGGRVVSTYGGPGGGRTLEELGVISGGYLTGPKARLALMFALGAGLDHTAIRALFGELAKS